ncbi:MAG: transposase [Acidobacteriaceae bacterium]
MGVLEESQGRLETGELCRKHGISEQTFYLWENQYVGMESDQVWEMKRLQDKNSQAEGGRQNIKTSVL